MNLVKSSGALALAQKLARKLGHESPEAARRAIGDSAFESKLAAEQKLLEGPVIDVEAGVPLSERVRKRMEGPEADRLDEPDLDQGVPDLPDVRLPGGKKAGAAAGLAGAVGASELFRRTYPETADAASPETPRPTDTDGVQRAQAGVTQEGGGATGPSAESDSTISNIMGADRKVKRAYVSPREVSDKSLRDALTQYEKASSELKQEAIDTTDIDSELAEARKLMQTRSDRRDMLQLVELISGGLANLAAARYSEKTGRSIQDRINQNRIDWAGKGQESREEYKLTRDELNERARSRREKARDEYAVSKDRLTGLREKVGVEGDLYKQGLSRAEFEARQRQAAEQAAIDAEEASFRDAARDTRSDKKDTDRTAGEVRQAAARELQSATDEEKQLTRLSTALADKKKASKLDLTAYDVPEELRAEATEEAAGDKWFGSPSEEEVNEKLRPKLLTHINTLKKEAEARKRQAQKDLRYGLPAADEASRGQQPPTRVIVHKATGATQPYSDDLWKEIQGSPKASEFSVGNR